MLATEVRSRDKGRASRESRRPTLLVSPAGRPLQLSDVYLSGLVHAFARSSASCQRPNSFSISFLDL